MYNRLVKVAFREVIEQAESEEEKEVVIYGFEAIVSNVVNLLIILLIGLISDSLLGTVVYLLCFFFIRVLAGGYHANTYFLCLMCSIVSYSIVVGVNPYINPEHNKILIVIASLSYIAILVMAPILNGKREFADIEINSLKKKVKIILLLELVITIVLYHINFELYKFAIYAIIMEGVLGTMGKIKYWNLNKKDVLKKMMNLSLGVALLSGWIPCLFAYHEPEMPKALKNKLEK